MRILVLALALPLATAAAAGEPAGFVPLFNGKDLDGWAARPNRPEVAEKWTVKDGVLRAAPGAGWLGTKKMYSDFTLSLEWRVGENGNSGVFLRVPAGESKASPSQTGLEIQILDDTGPRYKGKLKDWQYSGSLYGIRPPARPAYRGAGAWNTYEITCRGGQIEVVYNGVKVVEADAADDARLAKRPRRGYIGLQNHGSAVEFRNIAIKELAAPAP
jgi:hypothetical protein